MGEPDGVLRARTEGEDALLFDMLSRYDDDYNWMLDPEHHLLQDSDGHESIVAPCSPGYETEPSLSPDSNLQEGNFPTPSSTSLQSVMPATPSGNAFDVSNGMSFSDHLNSPI
jgi:hypothetical protein